jgi:hypothetical protein
MKKSPATSHHAVNEIYALIDNGTLEEFIAFAKEYNIFQEANSKFYTEMCERIKQRLTKEQLSIDTVRP